MAGIWGGGPTDDVAVESGLTERGFVTRLTGNPIDNPTAPTSAGLRRRLQPICTTPISACTNPRT